MEFKDILKELRKEKNLSLRALAKATELDFSTIARWERGEQEPGIYAIKILAKYFEVSAGYLLGLED